MKLKKKILLFEILCVLLPVIVIGSFFCNKIEQKTTDLYEKQNQELVEIQMNTIQNTLNELMNMTAFITDNSMVQKAILDTNQGEVPITWQEEALEGLARNIVQKVRYIKEIHFISSKGKVVGGSKPSWTGYQLSKEEKVNFIEDTSYRIKTKDNQEGNQQLVLSVPIKLVGKTIGACIQTINIGYMQELLDQINTDYMEAIFIVDTKNKEVVLTSKYNKKQAKSYENIKFMAMMDSNILVCEDASGETLYAYSKTVPRLNVQVVGLMNQAFIGNYMVEYIGMGLKAIGIYLLILCGLKFYILERLGQDVEQLKTQLRLSCFIKMKINTPLSKIVEFREIVEMFEEMVERINVQKRKMDEEKILYHMFSEKIRYHMYDIDFRDQNITHKGNLYHASHICIPYEGIESIFDREVFEILQWEEIEVLHQHVMIQESHLELDFQMKLPEEECYKWYNLSLKSQRDEETGTWHVIGFVSDVNERKQRELQLKELTVKDQLTYLYNKGYFKDYVMNRLKQGPKGKCYVVMLDIDDFKQINDKYGHLLADKLLIKSAQTLTRALKLASEQSIAARFGGDEFMLWVEEVEVVENMLDFIIKVFNQTDSNNPESVEVGISIGVVQVQEETSYDTLMKKADEALYEAKKLGKNQYMIKK